MIEPSPSMRREWIEITADDIGTLFDIVSPSMRREWIEMVQVTTLQLFLRVSLHAEGVD